MMTEIYLNKDTSKYTSVRPPKHKQIDYIVIKPTDTCFYEEFWEDKDHKKYSVPYTKEEYESMRLHNSKIEEYEDKYVTEFVNQIGLKIPRKKFESIISKHGLGEHE